MGNSYLICIAHISTACPWNFIFMTAQSTFFLAVICYGRRLRGSAGSRAITPALLFRVSALIGPDATSFIQGVRHFDILPNITLLAFTTATNLPVCYTSALRFRDTLFCLHVLALIVHHARICFHPVGRCGGRREREYRSRRQSWRLAGYGAMVSTAHALHGGRAWYICGGTWRLILGVPG